MAIPRVSIDAYPATSRKDIPLGQQFSCPPEKIVWMADFQEIFDELPDGVTLHDPADGAILESNQQFCEMLGYTREELLELEFDDLHVNEPPYTTERAEQHIRKAATEGPQTFEWLDETKDGEPLPVEVHLSTTTIDGDERVLAVVRDITDRKRREVELQRERDRFNALFQNASDAIVYSEFVDDEPIVRDINPAFQSTFGYEDESVIGRPIDEVIVPDDPDEQKKARALNRDVRAGDSVETEVRRQTVDGVRDFLFQSVHVEPEEGRRRTYVIYTDISAQKEHERELERYRTLVDAVGDPMFVLDPDGYLEIVNQSLADLGGAALEDLDGTHVSEFLGQGDVDRGTELIRELLAEPDRTWGTYEITVDPVIGEPFPAEVNLGLIQDEEGEHLGTAGVIRDLTEHKVRERRLERQNEQLDAFASIVSHDLRNPLNVARGHLELAQEDCDSEHHEAIGRAHERMDVLIEDLLSLARAEQTPTEPSTIELAEFVRDCWQSVDTKAGSIDVRTEATIEADETRLRQLLENLFRNAVEHAGDDVTVTVGDIDDGFFIEDDGPGIPEADRERVFEAGYSTTQEGTGFGMGIVKQVVDDHGWQIDLTRAENGGASIEITGVRGA